jgi:hypothetical protein
VPAVALAAGFDLLAPLGHLGLGAQPLLLGLAANGLLFGELTLGERLTAPPQPGSEPIEHDVDDIPDACAPTYQNLFSPFLIFEGKISLVRGHDRVD